jgi:predicted PolB exonuclease-like 3'-5' exonuclease
MVHLKKDSLIRSLELRSPNFGACKKTAAFKYSDVCSQLLNDFIAIFSERASQIKRGSFFVKRCAGRGFCQSDDLVLNWCNEFPDAH